MDVNNRKNKFWKYTITIYIEKKYKLNFSVHLDTSHLLGFPLKSILSAH